LKDLAFKVLCVGPFYVFFVGVISSSLLSFLSQPGSWLSIPSCTSLGT